MHADATMLQSIHVFAPDAFNHKVKDNFEFA